MSLINKKDLILLITGKWYLTSDLTRLNKNGDKSFCNSTFFSETNNQKDTITIGETQTVAIQLWSHDQTENFEIHFTCIILKFSNLNNFL